jgi:hypothetical protein
VLEYPDQKATKWSLRSFKVGFNQSLFSTIKHLFCYFSSVLVEARCAKEWRIIFLVSFLFAAYFKYYQYKPLKFLQS